jgi:hypothetical protein
VRRLSSGVFAASSSKSSQLSADGHGKWPRQVLMPPSPLRTAELCMRVLRPRRRSMAPSVAPREVGAARAVVGLLARRPLWQRFMHLRPTCVSGRMRGVWFGSRCTGAAGSAWPPACWTTARRVAVAGYARIASGRSRSLTSSIERVHAGVWFPSPRAAVCVGVAGGACHG